MHGLVPGYIFQPSPCALYINLKDDRRALQRAEQKKYSDLRGMPPPAFSPLYPSVYNHHTKAQQ